LPRQPLDHLTPKAPNPIAKDREPRRFRPFIHSDSSVRPHGIDDLQTSEMRFVFRDNHAIVRLGDCGNDHVEWASWPPFRRPVGHQPRPNEAGPLIERKHPANNAWGPSGPENQRSNSLRFFPAGSSRIPRRISATVIEEINRSSSACSAIHATQFSDGAGLVTLLMTLVSRSLLLTGQPGGGHHRAFEIQIDADQRRSA
jgi:hypothetical protein